MIFITEVAGDTFYKFSLHLRQRLTEEQFAEALEENDVQQHMRRRVEGFTIDENARTGIPSVRARDLENDEVFEGGKSTIRTLAGIAFNGERTTHRWIRMDARFHGQILWCPIDNGLVRMDVFSQALLEKYGGVEGVTQEVAVEFLEVDWFTIYGIGQAIAETFCAQDRVFLAGDACHTHSSGSAQGLNTGVHDAVNLSWKLALNILNLGKKSLLDSYNLERKPSVQRVIDNDKVISMLISGQYPPRFEGRKEDPRDILTEWYTDVNIRLFTLGLGSPWPSFNAGSANLSQASRIVRYLIPPLRRSYPASAAPDVYLTTIGTDDPIRLHQILKNDAKFHIVIFAGNPALSRPRFTTLQTTLDAPTSFRRAFPARRVFRFTTVAAVAGNGAVDVLGMHGFGGGRVYWDADGRAHSMYGVDVARGAVIVFRPDGWIGSVVALENVQDLGAYFADLLVGV
ncbi:FAD binding domain-containing protein [Mycena vulgaris]|nr:FAD binding domain-containing protein [Mycena vulgaris]